MLKLGTREREWLANFWPQLHHLSQCLDHPEPTVPGQWRGRQWSVTSQRRDRAGSLYLRLLGIERDPVMTHEQHRREISEHPACRKEQPHDIHGQVRVGVKQFGYRTARMRLDMRQRECFLLRLWGNLMGPEVL